MLECFFPWKRGNKISLVNLSRLSAAKTGKSGQSPASVPSRRRPNGYFVWNWRKVRKSFKRFWYLGKRGANARGILLYKTKPFARSATPRPVNFKFAFLSRSTCNASDASRKSSKLGIAAWKVSKLRAFSCNCTSTCLRPQISSFRSKKYSALSS